MKVLMVLTSHDKLGDTGKKTGFWLEEFAAPYYALLEDELLGGTRDAVAEKAEAYAEEHYDDVRDTAAKVSKNVKTAVKQETPSEENANSGDVESKSG